ncbi:hypothetical protein HDU97_005922 [Phlyctochytrium planicorne]|nr:hypothetical protein HDU97_005922 [Phlyctochytrium planicorne]
MTQLNMNLSWLPKVDDTKYKRFILFSLIGTFVGIILAIVSNRVEWVVATNYHGTLKYGPSQVRTCDSSGSCETADESACDVVKSAVSNKGNFCDLDENLRGLTIATAIFSSFALLPIIYIYRMGVHATPSMIYCIASFLTFFSALMAISGVGVGGTIVNIKGFKSGSNKADLSAGFYIELINALIFLTAGGMLLILSKSAPGRVDPFVRSQGHANFLKFGSQPQDPNVVYGGQQQGFPQQSIPMPQPPGFAQQPPLAPQHVASQ